MHNKKPVVNPTNKTNRKPKSDAAIKKAAKKRAASDADRIRFIDGFYYNIHQIVCALNRMIEDIRYVYPQHTGFSVITVDKDDELDFHNQ